MLLDYFKNYKPQSRSLDLTRDFYEMLIINELVSSKYRKVLVLKGLTASNLAYGIGSGDNKIEFVTLEEIYPREFLVSLKRALRIYPFIKIKNVSDKRYLYSIELEIQDEETIEITLEITKIKYAWKKGVNFDVKLLELKEWGFALVANVIQLSEIVNKHSNVSEISRIRL